MVTLKHWASQVSWIITHERNESDNKWWESLLSFSVNNCVLVMLLNWKECTTFANQTTRRRASKLSQSLRCAFHKRSLWVLCFGLWRARTLHLFYFKGIRFVSGEKMNGGQNFIQRMIATFISTNYWETCSKKLGQQWNFR